MVPHKLTAIVFALASLATSQNGFADLILQFSPSNTVTTINVTEYDPFSISLYIAQQGSETRLTNLGLLSFGVRGTYDAGLLTALGGSVSSDFPINGDPDIDISVLGQADMFGGSLSPPKSPSIFLGTFHFLAQAPGFTTINFGDLDSSFDDFSLNDSPAFTGIDQELFSPALNRVYGINVSITSVPEPSSFLFLTMVLSASFFATKLRSTKGKNQTEN